MPATLEPGQVMICTAIHITTQKDVDAASIVKTGTATGDSPVGKVDDDEEEETITAGLALPSTSPSPPARPHAQGTGN
jgi:hypothetical protein